MKADLKEMYSLEINKSLENYIPEEIDSFKLIICISIGGVDKDWYCSLFQRTITQYYLMKFKKLLIIQMEIISMI